MDAELTITNWALAFWKGNGTPANLEKTTEDLKGKKYEYKRFLFMSVRLAAVTKVQKTNQDEENHLKMPLKYISNDSKKNISINILDLLIVI